MSKNSFNNSYYSAKDVRGTAVINNAYLDGLIVINTDLTCRTDANFSIGTSGNGLLGLTSVNIEVSNLSAGNINANAITIATANISQANLLNTSSGNFQGTNNTLQNAVITFSTIGNALISTSNTILANITTANIQTANISVSNVINEYLTYGSFGNTFTSFGNSAVATIGNLVVHTIGNNVSTIETGVLISTSNLVETIVLSPQGYTDLPAFQTFNTNLVSAYLAQNTQNLHVNAVIANNNLLEVVQGPGIQVQFSTGNLTVGNMWVKNDAYIQGTLFTVNATETNVLITNDSITNAVITSGSVGNLYVSQGNLTLSTIGSVQVNSTANINIGNFTTGNFSTANINVGNFTTGNFSTANINIGNFTTGNFSTANINVGNFTTGNFTSISTSNFTAANAQISNLGFTYGNIDIPINTTVWTVSAGNNNLSLLTETNTLGSILSAYNFSDTVYWTISAGNTSINLYEGSNTQGIIQTITSNAINANLWTINNSSNSFSLLENTHTFGNISKIQTASNNFYTWTISSGNNSFSLIENTLTSGSISIVRGDSISNVYVSSGTSTTTIPLTIGDQVNLNIYGGGASIILPVNFVTKGAFILTGSNNVYYTSGTWYKTQKNIVSISAGSYDIQSNLTAALNGHGINTFTVSTDFENKIVIASDVSNWQFDDLVGNAYSAIGWNLNSLGDVLDKTNTALTSTATVISGPILFINVSSGNNLSVNDLVSINNNKVYTVSSAASSVFTLNGSDIYNDASGLWTKMKLTNNSISVGTSNNTTFPSVVQSALNSCSAGNTYSVKLTTGNLLSIASNDTKFSFATIGNSVYQSIGWVFGFNIANKEIQSSNFDSSTVNSNGSFFYNITSGSSITSLSNGNLISISVGNILGNVFEMTSKGSNSFSLIGYGTNYPITAFSGVWTKTLSHTISLTAGTYGNNYFPGILATAFGNNYSVSLNQNRIIIQNNNFNFQFSGGSALPSIGMRSSSILSNFAYLGVPTYKFISPVNHYIQISSGSALTTLTNGDLITLPNTNIYTVSSLNTVSNVIILNGELINSVVGNWVKTTLINTTIGNSLVSETYGNITWPLLIKNALPSGYNTLLTAGNLMLISSGNFNFQFATIANSAYQALGWGDFNNITNNVLFSNADNSVIITSANLQGGTIIGDSIDSVQFNNYAYGIKSETTIKIESQWLDISTVSTNPAFPVGSIALDSNLDITLAAVGLIDAQAGIINVGGGDYNNDSTLINIGGALLGIIPTLEINIGSGISVPPFIGVPISVPVINIGTALGLTPSVISILTPLIPGSIINIWGFELNLDSNSTINIDATTLVNIFAGSSINLDATAGVSINSGADIRITTAAGQFFVETETGLFFNALGGDISFVCDLGDINIISSLGFIDITSSTEMNIFSDSSSVTIEATTDIILTSSQLLITATSINILTPSNIIAEAGIGNITFAFCGAINLGAVEEITAGVITKIDIGGIESCDIGLIGPLNIGGIGLTKIGSIGDLTIGAIGNILLSVVGAFEIPLAGPITIGLTPLIDITTSVLLVNASEIGGMAFTCILGGIALTTAGGAIALTTGVGLITITAGFGQISITAGIGNLTLAALLGDVVISGVEIHIAGTVAMQANSNIIGVGNMNAINVTASAASFINAQATSYFTAGTLVVPTSANINIGNFTTANISTANINILNISQGSFINASTTNLLLTNLTAGNIKSSFGNFSDCITTGTIIGNQVNGTVNNIIISRPFLDNASFTENLGTVNKINSLIAVGADAVVDPVAYGATNTLLVGHGSSVKPTFSSNIIITSLTSGNTFTSTANILTANITTGNFGNVVISGLTSGNTFTSTANIITANITTGNFQNINSTVISTGQLNATNSTMVNLVLTNLSAGNIISTNTSFGTLFVNNTGANSNIITGKLGFGLIINNADGNANQLLLNNNTSGPAGIVFDVNNGNTSSMTYNTNQNLTLLSGTASLTLAQSNGFVGINKTNPSFALDVNGVAAAVSLTTGNVNATNSTITNLVATNLSAGNIILPTNVTFGNLKATNISTSTLFSTNITATNAVFTNLSAGNIILPSNATFSNLKATTISTGTLLSNTIVNSGGNIQLWNAGNSETSIQYVNNIFNWSVGLAVDGDSTGDFNFYSNGGNQITFTNTGIGYFNKVSSASLNTNIATIGTLAVPGVISSGNVYSSFGSFSRIYSDNSTLDNITSANITNTTAITTNNLFVNSAITTNNLFVNTNISSANIKVSNLSVGNLNISSSPDLIQLQASSGYGTNIIFDSTVIGGNRYNVFATGTIAGEHTDRFIIQDQTAGWNAICALSTSGNKFVGINTINPVCGLDVNGTFRADSISSGNLCMSGYIFYPSAGIAAYQLPTITTFTASNFGFTWPANSIYAEVLVIGNGGAGGPASLTNGGPGGGSGAWSKAVIRNTGVSYNVQVGGVGTNGSYFYNNATNEYIISGHGLGATSINDPGHGGQPQHIGGSSFTCVELGYGAGGFLGDGIFGGLGGISKWGSSEAQNSYNGLTVYGNGGYGGIIISGNGINGYSGIVVAKFFYA